ncbi:DUF5667 domain-containing protein [Nocardioides sp. SYSU DS0651]|uniref:DUF5667 domain-containing protein n=1 Tax=Nocardioides sp. SYSU DS0651 TaxID=3415955 RepID=UPI003F4C7656
MRGNAWSRRAEEFDALVSGKAGAGEDHAELLELVAALRAVPPVTARPEFVASLRTQLVAAAEREPARVDEELAARLTPRQRRGSRERRLAAVVGGFAVVSATGSMAMASQGALPGDALYPVKRAIENAQTNFQADPASKAESLLTHAESRLGEVEKLTARGADADVIAATLEDFTVQTEQAAELALDDYAATGKAEPIAELRAFAADSMDVLAALRPVVPTSVRPVLITATHTVHQVDTAAWEACPTCAEGAVTEVPDFATQPLSAVLSGKIPDQASVTQPVRKAERRAPAKETETETGQAPVSPDETPTLPADPSDGPTKPGDKLRDRVGKVTSDLGLGETPAPSPSGGTTDESTSLTGTLVDGVTGVLGGLLR